MEYRSTLCEGLFGAGAQEALEDLTEKHDAVLGINSQLTWEKRVLKKEVGDLKRDVDALKDEVRGLKERLARLDGSRAEIA